MATPWPERPVEAMKDEVLHHWQAEGCLVQSPPGSGKTTRLPLWLLEASSDGIVLVLPRRLPVQLAAQYMADQWQESPGQTIGYRLRQDSRVSANTRLTITTYGSFLRWLQNDPELSGVGTVILDEFHERQLDQDLCLTLLHSCRALFRPDLKLLVMSATLTLDVLQQALGLPRVVSDGVRHELSVHYRPGDPASWQVVLKATLDEARRAHQGHILVFLPGLREIEQAAEWIAPAAPVLKLHSQMPHSNLHSQLEQSDDAVILSTNLAESSVTLHGVRVVIDLGLERHPVTNPITGFVELRTRRISKSSAVQRAGRAARSGPGHCYRLWSVDQQNALAPDQPPAITQSDLSPLVLILADWGMTRTEAFWLTPPNPGRWQFARQQLIDWHALTTEDQLTEHGKRILALGQEPALAHLIALAEQHHQGSDAVWLAAALNLSEEWAERLLNQPGLSLKSAPAALREEAKHLARSLNIDLNSTAHPLKARVLINALSNRLVFRQINGVMNLANGSRVETRLTPLESQWALLLKGQDRGKSVLAQWLLPLDDTDVRAALKARTTLRFEMTDDHRDRYLEETWLGPFKVSEQAQQVKPEQRRQAWLGWLKATPITRWPGYGAVSGWLNRLSIARSCQSDWPELPQPEHLAIIAEPYLQNLDGIRSLPLSAIFKAWLGYSASQQLDTLCPTHWRAPSGRRCELLYDPEHNTISAELKLQEVFGLPASPTLVDGQKTLALRLLAPNGRVLAQVTDLSHFWSNIYPQVRKEMRGRYNKHPWPEDPLDARATAATNRQMARHSQENKA